MLNLTLLIFTLLVLATLIVQFRLRICSTPELLANQKRIQTWWTICVICIPVFYIGGWALTILLFVLNYWIAFEFSRLQKIRVNFARIFLFTVTIISYHVLIDNAPKLVNIFFILPAIFLVISLFFYSEKKAHTLLMMLFFIASIQAIQLISKISDNLGYDSGLIILFLFFITATNDIIQYLCGKFLGEHKLSPKLSPNKTIEGAIGGIFITSLIVAFTLPSIINISWITAALLGLVISTFGIIGDLNFSSLKRLAGVKDSGSSLPGHGGLLDRIDSLTLAAPGFGFCLNIVT